MSQRVKAIESQLGRVLLRRGKPVTATESGQAVVRLARQVELLQRDARAALQPAEGELTSIALAVNGDSLATWILPALARLSAVHPLVFDLHREDQAHSAELLRQGAVMAAVTSEAAPVQGCVVTPLARMRYRPMATAAFRRRWFPHGVTAEAISAAPVVEFDRKDDLQRDFVRSVHPGARPPQHFVPASAEFAAAVALGLGWGMVPAMQAEEHPGLEPLADGVDVPLYWQQWALDSPALALVAEALREAARSVH
ncbi:ArgP/LysG family DNA-binding transcriptional regulator [Arenivirga flava]|uniref:Transcriptional regulator ArgP n=1 Tax=Arenivirga flava TaxID=1930060 RepID=A0AA37UNN3_9MICO|nr:transcriptional regulator ArgP [Arenivirga flava]